MSTLLRFKLLRIALLCCIVLTMCLAVVPGASADDRVPCPPGVLPIWARTACPDCVVHDTEWAVIPFYYSPDEVPSDFNLFNLVDFSLMGRGLTPTVTGFEIWENWPPTAPAPLSAHWHGSGAVPVWFVPWKHFMAAAADGVLHVDELEALDGLVKGVATSYKETLVLHGVILGTSWVQQIQARGVLEDGRAFAVESTAHPPTTVDDQNTRIVFR